MALTRSRPARTGWPVAHSRAVHSHDGAWRPTGIGQYVSYLLILAGWVLTTAVVAGLTRVFNRT